jgi:hypothetical protein
MQEREGGSCPGRNPLPGNKKAKSTRGGENVMKKWKAFRNLSVLLAVTAVLLCPAVLTERACATEGGGGAYPNGAEDFMVGALPPPGTYFKNYVTYYTASTFKDNNGNDVTGPAGQKFKLNVFAETLRLIYVTKTEIFGASWAMHAFLPIVYEDVTSPSGATDNRWGLGDIIIDPIILGWHFPNFHVTTGLDIYLPTGTYDKNRLANAGRNYWTFEPVLAMTYLSDGGFELSGKFMYDFNTENSSTNYQSGQEFHFDYTVGYHIDKQWAVGLGGYCYFQTTDDKQNGVTVLPDGNRGQVYAIGPQAQYGYKNMNFTLKWQYEFDAKNKPEGNKFWFNFVYAF